MDCTRLNAAHQRCFTVRTRTNFLKISTLTALLLLRYIHRGPWKTCRQTSVHIFAKYWSIFKILSLPHCTDKLRRNYHDRFHLTQNVSLHYLVKYEFSKTAPTETETQQQQTKCTCTRECVIMVDKLVLSQQDQPQIYRLIHQTAEAGLIRIISSIVVLVWSV